MPSLSLVFALLVLAGSFIGSFSPLKAQDSDSTRFVLEGYGEILYQHYDYGPDRKSGENGSPEDNRATIGIPRAVFEMEYFFKPDLYLEAEIEIEYGGTGSALELEYEESGEYEHEVEKGGEIVLEGFHITKEFSPEFSLRAGHFILPIGLVNTRHEPDDFFGTVRPESETGIIPVTWHETGLEAFGTFGDLSYQLQVVNGLDATGFTSEYWVAEGHQTKFELVQATNLAVVAALEYSGVRGLTVGGSVYQGNSTGNRPKSDMEGIDGNVTIFDGHVVYKEGPLIARALALYGQLQNAEVISQKNSRVSRNLQVPRTPVASAAIAWYGEVGCDVLPFIASDSSMKLFPFLRYEHYNSMHETPSITFPDPRFERNVVTAGLNFFLTDDVVLKADFSHRTFGLDRYNDENTIGVAVGYSGEFLRSYR